jgi:hypothetical protein
VQVTDSQQVHSSSLLTSNHPSTLHHVTITAHQTAPEMSENVGGHPGKAEGKVELSEWRERVQSIEVLMDDHKKHEKGDRSTDDHPLLQ